MKEKVIKRLSTIAVLGMMALLFLYIARQTINFLNTYDVSRIITNYHHGLASVYDMILYILYLLFGIDVRTIDSIFDYFMR